MKELSEAAIAFEDDKILRFQKLCNTLGIRDDEGKALSEDNEFGPRTKSCIAKMATLEEGSKGAAVKFVQEVLHVAPVDGSFGPVTKDCVLKYQKDKNIEVDGIVGIQTWIAILTK